MNAPQRLGDNAASLLKKRSRAVTQKAEAEAIIAAVDDKLREIPVEEQVAALDAEESAIQQMRERLGQ